MPESGSGLVREYCDSDAADDIQCVDLGGRRIIKKKKSSSKTAIGGALRQVKTKFYTGQRFSEKELA